MNNFQIKQEGKILIRSFWVKVIALLFSSLVVMFITFLINVAMMMEQYTVDKMYADKDRKELATALKSLATSFHRIDNKISVDSKRLQICEENIKELR